MKKTDIRIPHCWICMDKGVILYHKQVGDIKAEYAARCTCQAGEAFNYDGTKCEKKSPYYIPVISQVMDTSQLAKENFHAWWQANKNKNDIEQAMRERGIPIPNERRQAGNDAAYERT